MLITDSNITNFTKVVTKLPTNHREVVNSLQSQSLSDRSLVILTSISPTENPKLKFVSIAQFKIPPQKTPELEFITNLINTKYQLEYKIQSSTPLLHVTPFKSIEISLISIQNFPSENPPKFIALSTLHYSINGKIRNSGYRFTIPSKKYTKTELETGQTVIIENESTLSKDLFKCGISKNKKVILIFLKSGSGSSRVDRVHVYNVRTRKIMITYKVNGGMFPFTQKINFLGSKCVI